MTDRRGTLLGKYRILDHLGEGGMGAVYRGRDEMLDRDVAIKVLRPELARQAELVARFRTEAVALARLAHPRIAILYGLERDGDELFMVMEHLRGETLEALVAREHRLSWRRAARICAEVAEALDHAHDHGVVHRDIKPANIMVGPGGSIKVMDFGIARMIGSSRQTRTGHTVGTPAYMAPEQLRGQETDGRTDLYALGAVLYELVTGRVAFEADSDYRMMMQQLNDPPPRPSGIVAELPSEIDGIVLTAMAKARDDRFPSAAAMRAALLECADNAALPSPPDAAAGEQLPETRHALASAAPAPVVSDDPAAIDPWDPAASLPADPGTSVAPIWLDWRSWATLAMSALAVGLLFRSPAPVPAPATGEHGADSVTTILPSPEPATNQQRGGSAVTPGPVEGIVRVAPPPAAPVVPTPPPSRRSNPPKRTPSPAVDTAPSPAPGPPPEEPAISPARERQAVAGVVNTWLARFADRDPGGVVGTVGGQPLASLIRDGRASVAKRGNATVTLDGDRATASLDATVSVRSAFGSTRTHQTRFHLELGRSGDSWTVRSVTVRE